MIPEKLLKEIFDLRDTLDKLRSKVEDHLLKKDLTDRDQDDLESLDTAYDALIEISEYDENEDEIPF